MMELHYFILLSFISRLHSAVGKCPLLCSRDQICDAEDSGCPVCLKTYYGRQCQHGTECIFNVKGIYYRGLRNITKKGRTCQRWDSQSPHHHHFCGDENYCRNPDNADGPWCYTTDPDVRWESCNIPLCDTMCPPPLLKSSGVDVINPPSDGFVIGYRAIIGCMVGFEASETPATVTVTCTRSKTWTQPLLPKCSIKKCQRPTLNNGFISSQTLKQTYQYKDKITIVCDEGYTLQGEGESTCQADTTWWPLSKCTMNECGQPELKPNSRIISNITFQYEDVVTFECETGYIMQGPTQLTCQANKTWNADPPTCKILECTLPLLPAMIKLQNPKHHYSYGDIITFSCIEGYGFDGGNIAVCNATGQWSEPFPVCKKIVKILSSIVWIGITVGVSLATALGSVCVTVLIMSRNRPIDRTNRKKDAIAMDEMVASFDYDVTNTSTNDDQHVYELEDDE